MCFERRFAHWQSGLGIWAVPALVALLLWWWLPFTSAAPTQGLEAASIRPWRNRRAWLLALYFGLVNCGYMSMVAWLPAYYLQMDWSAIHSGALLAFMTIFQVIGALLMPALAQPSSARRYPAGADDVVWMQRRTSRGDRRSAEMAHATAPTPRDAPPRRATHMLC